MPYSEYSVIQQLQAEETTRVFDAWLIDQIIQLVEGPVAQPKKGTSVLDVGCGQGHAIDLWPRPFQEASSPGLISLKKTLKPQGGKQGKGRWG